MNNPTEEKAIQPVGLDYWSQSRRPLTSLLFAGPLLVIYEAGVIFLGPNAQRNGADAWLRGCLKMLGFREHFGYFLLPVLTVGILLGRHYVSRQPWRVSRQVLGGMVGESLALAGVLWLSWKVIARAVGLEIPGPTFAERLGTINSYFGAGIYEELLFRMILMNVVAGLLVWMHAPRKAGLIGGIAISSVLFSAAHYVGPYGDAFNSLTAFFRFLAGAFFAVLYIYRGFGIAAGAHALYDVLVFLSTG